MSGLYEIHITVDHNEGFYNLLKYVNGKKNMKVLFAFSKGNNYQYMVTHFTSKNSIESAVHKALDIATDLKKAGITVLRTKIEMRNSVNMPMTREDYDALKHKLDETFHGENNMPYFEFHLKVATHMKDGSVVDFDVLEGQMEQFQRAVISYNLCSTEKKPILTIRCYSIGYHDAIQYKNLVVDSLKTIGYIFEDKIQEEFAVYDSNPSVDNGWLDY